jgi:hypothetical protein
MSGADKIIQGLNEAITMAKVMNANADLLKNAQHLAASLTAAISIIERAEEAKVWPSRAVSSNKIFHVMLNDYRNALEAFRVATAKAEGK